MHKEIKNVTCILSFTVHHTTHGYFQFLWAFIDLFFIPLPVLFIYGIISQFYLAILFLDSFYFLPKKSGLVLHSVTVPLGQRS